MSNYLDSRAQNVDLDYDSLDIFAPITTFHGPVLFDQNVTFGNNVTFSNFGSTVTNATLDIQGTLDTLLATNTINGFTTLPNHTYMIDFTTVGWQDTAATAYCQSTKSKIVNAAGVVTITFAFSNAFSNGIAGAGQSITNAGAVVNTAITQTANGNLTHWAWELKIFSSPN
jgi:hypothetical protein